MPIKYALKTLSLAALCLSFTACKSGYNRLYTSSDPDENAPPCTENSITDSPSTQAAAVYSLISDLTCKKTKGYILSGQSLGDGNQINGNDNNKNYATLIDNIARSEKRRIAIASIDYENSAQFSAAELTEANKQLITHANTHGGIVSISWTPQNPFPNANNSLAHTADVALANLYSTDEVKPIGYTDFNDRLAPCN
ncbi:MAG: hypothetical protein U5M23_11430 [Marinagarivorans sp.]|nr:hypothetical protein [Marinagarivorans sp.]